MTYPVASFLIQIKNAYMANLNEVSFPYSKIVLSIGKILKEEGYVKDAKEESKDGKKYVKVNLLYKKNSAAMTARKSLIHIVLKNAKQKL